MPHQFLSKATPSMPRPRPARFKRNGNGGRGGGAAGEPGRRGAGEPGLRVGGLAVGGCERACGWRARKQARSSKIWGCERSCLSSSAFANVRRPTRHFAPDSFGAEAGLKRDLQIFGRERRPMKYCPMHSLIPRYTISALRAAIFILGAIPMSGVTANIHRRHPPSTQGGGSANSSNYGG